jgi:Dullard-like phosphatase family protein
MNHNNNNNNKELNTKKFLSNSLPDINLNNKGNLLICENKSNLDLTEEQNFNKSSDNNNNININEISVIKKGKKNNKSNSKNNKNEEIDNIDTSMNFLRDLTSYTAKFVLFLKLMQTHMDIAILINNSDNSKGTFRKKATIVLSSDVIFKMNALLNNYFNILSVIYNDKVKNLLEGNINSNFTKKNKQLSSIAIDCFFLLSSLNNIFHKIIKVQMCLHSSILVTLSQLGPYELNNMIKTCFNIILKKTTNSLLNLFEFFIKEDLNLNYPDLIKNNLGQYFYDQINKLTKVKKKAYKNSEILLIISNDINKAYELMKNYTTEKLKYSLIKPFGDAVNQMLSSIDKKNLYQFVKIFLKSLLFGELEINKKKITEHSLNFKSRFNGLRQINKNFNACYGGSSFMNNIQEIPPYLPQKNPKYKYTLVLDMDETLLHFFFTQINGMFFVRPYCFEFLNELNNLYEIITFTAGTKDYADNILNQLDINDNIIKYRLYRQHTTISGLTTYKDLNKLGRDLSKIIIIDNLKDNFKMQPNNGIYIKTWTNDINDCQLKDLLKLLKDIVIFNIDDVRPILQKMNEEIKSNGNMINPYSNISIQKLLGHASKRKKFIKEQ